MTTPIARPPPDGALSGKRVDGAVDDELDRVRPGGRIGQIPDGEVPGELGGGESGGHDGTSEMSGATSDGCSPGPDTR
ncbi:hypothetical protein OHS18_07210 [Amycolatopsis sp. NBC_00355]|uniref:hypothetical protein n=1 Tax=Amycolatopsis sp. NBC_00355 TaxID=2975957 RepID=UPI002E25E663